jgi:exodeoxyribonuclease-3
LDYHVITPGLVAGIRSADVYKDERFSDHAPFTMDYDYSL